MKSGAKCRNWGILVQLRVTQGHRQCHHSIVRNRRGQKYLSSKNVQKVFAPSFRANRPVFADRFSDKDFEFAKNAIAALKHFRIIN